MSSHSRGCIVSPCKKNKYLPPANEVWGKVMFLHLSVILFGGRGVSQHAVDRGVCITACNGQGLCIPACTGAGGVCPGDVWWTPPRQTPLPQRRPLKRNPPSTETATEAGGTHPTGLHSCLESCL